MPDRLLILDDDPLFANFHAKIANSAGYEVREITDPTTFEEALNSWRPTHIMVDLNMPTVDGIEALQILARPASNAKIVICSGAAQDFLDAVHRLGQRLGLQMSGVIQKPVRPQELKSLLENLATESEPKSRPGLPFDRDYFDEVCVTMGKEWTAKGLTTIATQIEHTFGDEKNTGSADRGQLARDAHALASLAGMLGFSEFSQLCRDLEEACGKGGDFSSPLRQAQAASGSVCRTANEMAADLTVGSPN